MDSTAQTTPVALEIINETASTRDPWIRQRKQPLWLQKSSTKTQSLPNQKSSTKTESLGTQKTSTKLLARVTKNHQRNCFHG